MNVDRTGLKHRRPFQHMSTEELQGHVDNMESSMIGHSWMERKGRGDLVRTRALNKALMTGKAILAERSGDLRNARRIRETLEGIEGRLDSETSDYLERIQNTLRRLAERYNKIFL